MVVSVGWCNSTQPNRRKPRKNNTNAKRRKKNMAKNELILTKENVNALCNKELKQDLVIMLEAIATGNQCVWDYAIAVHNIIETESFSDDLKR